MLINVPELKRTIVKKNTTLEAVASVLGINRSTLYRKLKCGSAGITLRDAHYICEYLQLSEHETRNIFWQKNGPPM